MLRAFAEGRINHINEGLCPDSIAGPNSRDPDCRVCRALDGAAPAAVAGPHVTDAMALAFHSALSDGAIGSDEVEEIKAGLRAALAAAPTTQPVPRLPERDASIPAEQQGLFRKFDVRRVDGTDKPGGKHHGCTYFVLDLDHDPCARPALAAYAAACESTHPTLSADLRTKWGAVPTAQPAPQQEAQEPVAWQSRTRPTWGDNDRPWSLWEPCTKGQAEDCWKTPLLHDWAYEARALYTAPQPSPASQGDALDAARYRYLTRSMGDYCITHAVDLGGVLKAAAADAAIDAARAAHQEGEAP